MPKLSRKKLLIILLVLPLVAFFIQKKPIRQTKATGQVLQASSRNIIVLPHPGNHRDIQPSLQTAVDAASNGDIIVLPAGEFYLDKQVNIIDKFVSIRGQGSSDGGTKLYRREDLSDEIIEAWP